MLGGQIVLDGFVWIVTDVELPQADPATGAPTGVTIPVRQLIIKDGDLLVTIQLLREQMVELGTRLAGSQIVRATQMPGANGRSPILPG